MLAPQVKFLINLERSQDRLQWSNAQLEKHSLNDVQLWRGVDGAKEDVYEIAEKIGLTGRKLPKGKMGCFLSHYMLWQHCYEKGYDKVWIMEDDMFFRPDWKKDLALVPDVEYDLVYLCAWRHALPLENRVPDEGDKHVKGKLWEVNKASSNLSYFVSRNALEVLLKELKEVKQNQDLQMRDDCFEKLRTFAFFPNLVHQSQEIQSISTKIDGE